MWAPVSGQFKYQYTLSGQYQSVTMPSGATRNFSYDDQGRLTQLSNLASGGGNLATYGYGYDFNYTTGQNTMPGQRSSLTATVPAQGLTNHLFKYEYDQLYGLNRVTYPNVVPFNAEVDSWTYDAIGNRLTNTVNGSTQTYTYQKIGSNPLNWQRLLSDGVNSYTYDANGSTITTSGTPGNFTFGWNYENRMSSVSGSATASYVYDYRRRRSSKTVSGSTSTYLYDGVNPIQEQGATPADYLLGPSIDEPLAMSRGGQVYYYGVDGLGSAATVANSGGTVQNSYLYDAWGQTRTQAGTLANPFGYTAREFGEAGTLFYRARYYSPGIGRFASEDPLDFSGGHASLYAYVGSDPTNRIDPFGLLWIYKQSTGQLFYQNDQTGDTTLVGTGYAGHNAGLNKPDYQNVPGDPYDPENTDAGPLPQGYYTIGPQQDNVTGDGRTLYQSEKLTPDLSNYMFGRSGFFFHGTNDPSHQSSSQGCPVLKPHVRTQIGQSPDKRLKVVP